MERCNECKMCDAIITIERRVVALEKAAKENQCGQAPLHTTAALCAHVPMSEAATAQHTQLAKCPTCGGQGWYIDAAIGNDGEPVPIQQQCQHCGGSGIQQASA